MRTRYHAPRVNDKEMRGLQPAVDVSCCQRVGLNNARERRFTEGEGSRYHSAWATVRHFGPHYAIWESDTLSPAFMNAARSVDPGDLGTGSQSKEMPRPYYRCPKFLLLLALHCWVDFRRKSPFISETVRDRPMVTMER